MKLGDAVAKKIVNVTRPPSFGAVSSAEIVEKLYKTFNCQQHPRSPSPAPVF